MEGLTSDMVTIALWTF